MANKLTVDKCKWYNLMSEIQKYSFRYAVSHSWDNSCSAWKIPWAGNSESHLSQSFAQILCNITATYSSHHSTFVYLHGTKQWHQNVILGKDASILQWKETWQAKHKRRRLLWFPLSFLLTYFSEVLGLCFCILANVPNNQSSPGL